MLYADAGYVLHKILHWETAQSEVDGLKSRLSQIYYDNLPKLTKPMDGLEEWLDAVSTARIPCAVVSSLDRRNMIDALDRIGLKKYFQAIVSEEDGMESIAHTFLSAAMKLDCKPSNCVAFEDDPRSNTAAHNCTMMAVALIGSDPAYYLVQADLAVGNFNELSVINLRRLFANKVLPPCTVKSRSWRRLPRKGSLESIPYSDSFFTILILCLAGRKRKGKEKSGERNMEEKHGSSFSFGTEDEK